jgi:hypothetical protein
MGRILFALAMVGSNVPTRRHGDPPDSHFFSQIVQPTESIEPPRRRARETKIKIKRLEQSHSGYVGQKKLTDATVLTVAVYLHIPAYFLHT